MNKKREKGQKLTYPRGYKQRMSPAAFDRSHDLFRCTWGVNGHVPTEVTDKDVEFAAEYLRRKMCGDSWSRRCTIFMEFEQELAPDILKLGQFFHHAMIEDTYQPKNFYGTHKYIRFIAKENVDKYHLKTKEGETIYRIKCFAIERSREKGERGKKFESFIKNGIIHEGAPFAILHATEGYRHE